LWIAANGWILYHVHHVRKQALGFWQWQNTLPFWIVAAFVLVTLFIALTTAPNNWDSQTYHLPRIEHWVQNGSLEVYPTSIMRQNETGPLAETLLLQTRVLSGSDFFYPLVQWVSMLCSIAAVFRITRQLGGSNTQCWDRRGFSRHASDLRSGINQHANRLCGRRAVDLFRDVGARDNHAVAAFPSPRISSNGRGRIERHRQADRLFDRLRLRLVVRHLLEPARRARRVVQPGRGSGRRSGPRHGSFRDPIYCRGRDSVRPFQIHHQWKFRRQADARQFHSRRHVEFQYRNSTDRYVHER